MFKNEVIAIVPISKVFSIIDSCTNSDQLIGARGVADAYTTLARSKGVVNPELVDQTLKIKIKEKEEEIERVENFCIK